MKKIILLTLVSICLLSGCQKETVTNDTPVKKVYVQVTSYSSDGTFFNSEIEVGQ